MSFSSPREAASAEAARFNAGQASQLADISLPAIQSTLSSLFSDINVSANGTIGVPKSVEGQYNQVKGQTNQDFGTATRAGNAYIAQSAKQSGNPYSTTMVGDETLAATSALETSRREAQRNIDYQENIAGLAEYNEILSLIGASSGAALNLAGGFSGAQAQAIGDLSNQSRGGGALGGGLAGASAGSVAGPYGALIGGVVGAAGGYFSAGG